jgi:predicted aminopeptidase
MLWSGGRAWGDTIAHMSCLRCLLLLIYIVALSGCSSVGYYWQAIHGHFDIVAREQPIKTLLQKSDLDPALRHKLELIQQARRFASDYLAMPDNDSYTEYADLQRPFVTWNVIVTPEFSVEPKQWCYLFAGCFNYRGYFHKADALAFAKHYQHAGDDVAISGAWAYSTLGWFADPVLNTMLQHDDTDVIGTLFHELGHQTVYVKDDSSFNESFANAVEQEGLRRWYLHTGQPAQYQNYLLHRQQRQAIIQMLEDTRAKLRALYAQTLSPAQKREGKRAIFAALKQQYQRWREHHSYSGYDRWMAQDLNNAHLALIATYSDKVPAFLAMLAAQHGNLPAFYREAKRIGDLPPQQRLAALQVYQHAASNSVTALP